MRQSLRQHASLLLLAILIVSSFFIFGCSSFKVSDWEASVTLPASLDCYSFAVVSGRETRLPHDSKECMEKKLKSVWIDYENYKKLKSDILKNCQSAKCKEVTGAFDDLFLTLDNILKKYDTL